MRIGAVCTLLVAFTASSFAGVITMTHTGTGTGTIGGTPFTNAAFTITDVGDTGNRVSFGTGFFIDDTTASIAIAGVGTFTFTSGTRTFVNNSNSTPGFSRAGSGGADLFNGPTNAAFATWDMLSSIGPIGGTASLLQWSSPAVTTSGGTLVFNNGTSDTVFTATVGGVAVPEPATWLLITLGLAGVGLIKRRQRL